MPRPLPTAIAAALARAQAQHTAGHTPTIPFIPETRADPRQAEAFGAPEAHLLDWKTWETQLLAHAGAMRPYLGFSHDELRDEAARIPRQLHEQVFVPGTEPEVYAARMVEAAERWFGEPVPGDTPDARLAPVRDRRYWSRFLVRRVREAREHLNLKLGLVGAGDRNRFANARRATSLGDTSVKVVRGGIGSDGVFIGYDKLGRRTLAEYSYGTQAVSETYGYSSDGYLQTTKQGGVLVTARVVDALGRTTRSKDLINNQETQSDYDADNRLIQQRFFDGKNDTKNYRLDFSYYAAVSSNASSDLISTASATGKGALAKTVVTPTSAPSSTTTTTYTYEYWDGAQQSLITKAPSGGSAGYTYFYYNTNGHIRRTVDSVANVDNRYFNTATGLVLQRDRYGSGSSHHFFYYADDHRVGDVSDTPEDIQRVSYAEQLAMKPMSTKRSYYRLENIGQALQEVEYQDGSRVEEWQNINQAHSTADFDQNYEPINDNYPGAAASSYTVRSDGETLMGIAQALWGDRSMWYLIADANGLAITSALKAGQLLVIPNKVTNIHNNSSTWRPYNAGEAIGRTDPTVPTPPPPAKKGCGGIGTLIMVVVAVAATIYTAGAAATALGFTSGGVWSTGLAALSGGLGTGLAAGAAAAASAVVGGVVGSIASQGVGLAIGQIDSFSWKAVGQAGLGAGVTAGVGSLLQTAGYLEYASGASWGANATAAAGRAAIGTGVNMALHNDWSWQSVMISAVSAGVGSAVGSAINGSAYATAVGEVGQRFTSGLAGSLAARALTSGNRSSYETVFASTLGSVLGENLANPAAQDQGANNRTLLNAAERIADPDRYTSWKGQFPDLSQFYGQPWAGDNVAQAVDRSQDIQLAAAKGYDGIGLGKATAGDEPGTVQFNTLRGAGYRKRINFDGTTQEYYVLDPVEVTGQSLRSMSASAAPRVLTMPALDSSVSFLQAADLAPLSGGVTMQSIQPLPVLSFQEVNEQHVIAGTYDRFQEIGNAWSDGRYGDVWRHLNFEASDAGKAAVSARLFPQANPNLTRIDTMAASPWGATASLIGRAFGASQQRQDALLQTGAFFENGLGAATGIYKQTLTAPPPMSTTLARVRSSNRPASPLLPNEGKVGTYDELLNAGTKGDNITPHHIPSAKLMQQYGVSKGDGISINMEMPSPGVGGRHRQTFTYGNSADVDMLPRDALAAGIRDARSIYQQDGLYDAYVRQQLQEMIRQNKATYPAIFQKKQ